MKSNRPNFHPAARGARLTLPQFVAVCALLALLVPARALAAGRGAPPAAASPIPPSEQALAQYGQWESEYWSDNGVLSFNYVGDQRAAAAPGKNPDFTIGAPTLLTALIDVHVNPYAGQSSAEATHIDTSVSPGSLWLVDDAGNIYGPFAAERAGAPVVNGQAAATYLWVAGVDHVELPPGHYYVHDSDPASLVNNGQTLGVGATFVKGVDAAAYAKYMEALTGEAKPGTLINNAPDNNAAPGAIPSPPSAPAQFVTDKPVMVTKILDYHLHGGRGQTPGQISLQDQAGTTYGPWQAYGQAYQGIPNAIWAVSPNAEVPEGTYTVVDSDLASQSAGPDGRALCVVESRPVVTGPLNNVSGKYALRLLPGTESCNDCNFILSVLDRKTSVEASIVVLDFPLTLNFSVTQRNNDSVTVRSQFGGFLGDNSTYNFETTGTFQSRGSQVVFAGNVHGSAAQAADIPFTATRTSADIPGLVPKPAAGIGKVGKIPGPGNEGQAAAGIVAPAVVTVLAGAAAALGGSGAASAAGLGSGAGAGLGGAGASGAGAGVRGGSVGGAGAGFAPPISPGGNMSGAAAAGGLGGSMSGAAAAGGPGGSMSGAAAAGGLGGSMSGAAAAGGLGGSMSGFGTSSAGDHSVGASMGGADDSGGGGYSGGGGDDGGGDGGGGGGDDSGGGESGDSDAGSAPQPVIDIISNSPWINGGPGENSSTHFDGGKGPGGCSPMGLPNYWVNTANLNLSVEDTVYTYRGLGPRITLKLSYNSAPGKPGMFGRNWRFCYDSVIELMSDRFLVWKGSGQRLSFRRAVSPASPTPEAPVEALTLEGSRDRLFDYGEYLVWVESESHLCYRYETLSGGDRARLASITDQNGNTVKLTYDPDGCLHFVTDAAGRAITLAYDGYDRCVGLSLPDGRQTKYTYNQQGNLTQAIDLLGTVAVYHYDRGNSLTRMVVGRDQKTTKFIYQNSERGRYLASVTDAAGNTTRYELVSVEPRHVRLTTPDGQRTSCFSTLEGYTESVVDPLGNKVVTSYANGLPVSHTTANKHTSRIEYDAHGHAIRMTDPWGAVWARTYDEDSRLTSETDPLGAVWRYAYDTRGNLVRMVSPEGRALLLEVDGKGQVIAMGDSPQHRVRFAYDACGNVISRTDPAGNTAQMAYDPAGLHLIAYTDARGQVTRYTYDANDRLTRVMYPDGTFRAYAYDCCTGTSTVDENGNTTNYRRDPVLMLNEQTDAAGGRSLFAYDSAYRLVKSSDALGHTTTYGYDAAGRQVYAMDPLGQMIQSQYDAANNLVARINPLGHIHTFEYDAANRLVRTTDPLGQALTITRDAVGRPAEILTARGGNVGLAYSANGELVAKTYDGVGIAAYTYDDLGRLARLEDPTGTSAFTYDPAGQVSTISYPDGTQVACFYDASRNLNRILYPGNVEVRYTYDQRNRVTQVAWQGQAIAYQYNGTGDVIRQTCSNGVESTYACDAQGRTLDLRHARGGQPFIQISHTRNALGDIEMETGRHLVSAPRAESGPATVYNALDQVQSRDQERYTYDADGNLTAISGNKWQATYDPENRLQTVTRDGQTVAYLYNGLGQRVQAATGSTVRNYHYDLQGRLLFETNGAGQVTRCYLYSGALLAARYTPDGQSCFYHFDHLGSTLAVTDAAGNVAAAYAYTPFGVLAGQSGDVRDNAFTFVGAYGVMDEGGGLYYMTNRCYDANTGRFIQKDPLGPTVSRNLYGYVGNNPLNRIDPLGLIDRGFPNSAFHDWRPNNTPINLGPAIAPLAVTANIGIGVAGVAAAVTGIMSGGSIPLAVVGIGMGASRIYSTVKRVIDGDYGADYEAADAPADLADPTKGLRKVGNWVDQTWPDTSKPQAATDAQLAAAPMESPHYCHRR